MGNVEIPKWLKNLPLAPEFHPTDTEFADPIAYISKIEKQASAFGICKIIPPLPKPSKKYVFYNLNKSLSKSPELIDGASLPRPSSSLKTGARDGADEREARAVFTTRHQELGQCTKKTKGNVKENPQSGAHKQVWQSGEIYTLEQFESKSKAVARSLLGSVKEINAMVIEALFWRAASEKPIYVEYANDVPGSAFGEPEGQFQYFHKRRRKRVSYKSFRPSKEKTHCENIDLDIASNLSRDRDKGTHSENEPSSSTETIPISSTTSTSHAEETSRSSSDDMAGSAGWKLSNSPWNLQVIARSPGSLTRFMPDDIPGVTSPMVYIGMLFSWFAWHVEDHELHSMNFLHTGSPKTWYSVPGDYAFTFEEVIRTEAYGGKIDRLAALSMLGEKTTILSPEVVVSSGIPCCRLVQNPGEFVVTFPRAYHIGFSHGFNCGEAANFGTPQWLKVAKEAAVRRAAMNFLPMLSHQHLLYLLTMSFVSRVPRSFLPGARSSRLRDRMKEERELSVKKAFIEDVLEQNNTLSVIPSKESDFGVLIWNPDLLPCASKESQSPSMNSSMTEENVHHTRSEDNSNATGSDLLEEMNLYMGTLNNLYMDNDDISSDFQVDSGTLVCAACGILGFPFMTVIQPSDQASTECFVVDHPLVQHGCDAAEPTNSHSSALPNGSFRCSFRDLTVPSGWNNSNKFLRPRIFCLEHGFQIEELLRSKGGSNRRIICHSDFQKIKAHAVTIAEEIGTPFQYKEVPLRSASLEELNLIYLALEGEDRGEDWTSKMGINLQYCVNARKNSPSLKVQHALALGGLFSDSFALDFSIVKWQSRKPRSRMKLPHSTQPKALDAVEPKEDNVLGRKPDSVIEKEDRLIQYTRRKHKAQIDASSEKIMEQVSLFAPTVGVESVATQVENCILSESKKNGNACDLTAAECVSSRFGENGDSDVLGCSETCVSEAIEMPKMQGEHRIVGDTSVRNDILNSVSEEKHDHLARGEQIGNGTAMKSCTNDEAFDETSSDRVMQTRQEENASSSAMQVETDRSKEDLDTNRNNREEPDSCFSCQMPDTTVHIGLENLDAEEKEIHLDNGLSMNNEVKNITEATNALNRKECPLKSCSQTEDESLGADNSVGPIVADPMPTSKKGSKRKSELDQLRDDQSEMDAFIRSPCEGLRPRAARDTAVRNPVQDDPVKKKARKLADTPVAFGKTKAATKRPHKCDLEGCKMSFETNAELQLHKRNRCPYEGCGKRFSSHKYAVIHQRVHEDDRPLKCPWKGCSMSFKWAWARTEHIRVHTGEKPYKCKVEGCGRSFRFVSDFSRHRRKTGHSGA